MSVYIELLIQFQCEWLDVSSFKNLLMGILNANKIIRDSGPVEQASAICISSSHTR